MKNLKDELKKLNEITSIKEMLIKKDELAIQQIQGNLNQKYTNISSIEEDISKNNFFADQITKIELILQKEIISNLIKAKAKIDKEIKILEFNLDNYQKSFFDKKKQLDFFKKEVSIKRRALNKKKEEIELNNLIETTIMFNNNKK